MGEGLRRCHIPSPNRACTNAYAALTRKGIRALFDSSCGEAKSVFARNVTEAKQRFQHIGNRLFKIASFAEIPCDARGSQFESCAVNIRRRHCD